MLLNLLLRLQGGLQLWTNLRGIGLWLNFYLKEKKLSALLMLCWLQFTLLLRGNLPVALGAEVATLALQAVEEEVAGDSESGKMECTLGTLQTDSTDLATVVGTAGVVATAVGLEWEFVDEMAGRNQKTRMKEKAWFGQVTSIKLNAYHMSDLFPHNRLGWCLSKSTILRLGCRSYITTFCNRLNLLG